MKPGDQRLIHGLNGLAVVLAWFVATWLGGAPLATPVSMGAGCTALAIAGIGIAVRVLTTNGPTWQKLLAANVFVGQLGFVGWVIWRFDPAGGPFAAGVMAVLGATVVAALIDGVKQQRQEQQQEQEETNE